MEKRPVGTSGLKVAPLALGGNVFGWTADERTSFDILDAFVDRGGTMIDTADVYSAWVPGHQGGESETVIGRWLKRDPSKRDKVVIATKTGMLGLDPTAIAPACDNSLKRLGVEKIDLFYQHRDDPAVPLTDSLGAYDQLLRQGKIGAIGLSNFTAERVDEAMDAALRHGLARPSALQCWYNLVERAKFEDGLRDCALRHGLGVFGYYGLANGFLTGKYRKREDLDRSPRGLRTIEYLGEKGMAVLAELDRIAAETGASLATIALAWAKAKPAVTAPIASATSIAQAGEVLAALAFDLTADQIERLDRASA